MLCTVILSWSLTIVPGLLIKMNHFNDFFWQFYQFNTNITTTKCFPWNHRWGGNNAMFCLVFQKQSQFGVCVRFWHSLSVCNLNCSFFLNSSYFSSWSLVSFITYHVRILWHIKHELVFNCFFSPQYQQEEVRLYISRLEYD